MGILLFEHNLSAYNSAIKMMEDSGKAAIIHPTGTGKSFIGFKLCEDNPDKNICWLSPSDYIFKTQIENLKNVSDGYFPENISFYTYAKLIKMSETEFEDIKPDYIVLDEFHRCGAEVWGQGVKKLFELYPDVPVLGLSATAIRYLDNQRDMSDELFDGNIASEMTLGEAIVRGILNPPKYVLALFSYQKELEKYERRIRSTKSKLVRDKGENYLEILKRTLEKADGIEDIFSKHISEKSGKYIVFCTSFEHMSEMVSLSSGWFSKIDKNPHIYTAYSSDPETSKAFENFKADDSNHLKLLYCIDMLNEGIHVDDISGVILLRPTVSPIIYKQQIGRALSASKNTNAVIFDIVLNFENLYSISDIKDEMTEAINLYREFGREKEIINEHFSIIDEIRDCKEIFDEIEKTLSVSWDNMYALAKQYYLKNGDLLPKSDYKTEEGYNLGQWIVTQRIQYLNKTLSSERICKLEEIGMSWKTLRERQWEHGFALAEDFYNQHGNLNVPISYKELYPWILLQRSNYRTQRINKEQYTRLSDIGMIWEVEDTWMQKYYEAKKYYEKNGNLDIPAEYVTENGVNLGIWYRRARDNYRKGILSEERIKLFEDIGVNWTSIKIRTWNNYFKEAKKYYEANGNLNIKADYVTESGLNLGIWISSQRDSYAKKRLNQEQADLLESIGMCWHRDKGRWQVGLEHAQRYFDEFGNMNAPSNYVCDDGFTLGAWLNSQRLKYKKDKLKKEHIEKLEKLNIIWFQLDAAWEVGYEHICEYYRMNGNCRVPSSFVTDDGFKLGIWVANQRTKYRTGKLSDYKIKRLEELSFEWNSLNIRWESNYAHAKAYFEKHGNLYVANDYVLPNGFKLGQWLATQKADYKKGKLDNKKIVFLERLGILWTPNEEKWLRAFECAKRYALNHNSIKIPYSYVTPDGFKLGEWYRTQKRTFEKGNYSQERLSMMQKAGLILDDKLPVGFSNIRRA